MSPNFLLTTSWDDGHPLDFRVADLLVKHRLRGTFYVPMENSRPTLAPEQILELSQTFEIGAHTVHHSVLTTVALEEAEAEITQSKTKLEQITGKRCAVFCFPKGRYRSAHLAIVGEAGFSGARTSELMSFDRPRTKCNVAVIATTIQACPHPLSSYVRNAVKRHRYGALWKLALHSRGRDWASLAISLLQRARQTGGIFHLWGHSWEIEEHQQWKSLDRVMAAMAEASRSAACLTNSELCCNA